MVYQTRSQAGGKRKAAEGAEVAQTAKKAKLQGATPKATTSGSKRGVKRGCAGEGEEKEESVAKRARKVGSASRDPQHTPKYGC